MALTDILVGAPTSVKVGAYGDAEGSCVTLGTTEGGLKIANSEEYYDVKTDQNTGIINKLKVSQGTKIEVTLNEVSLANLAYAFGDPTTAVDGTTFSHGGSFTVTKRTVYINASIPDDGGTVKVTCYKAVITGNTEMSFVKDNKVTLKLEIELLEDYSRSEGDRLLGIEISGTDTTAPTVAMTTPAEDGTVTKDAKGTVTLTFTEGDNKLDEGTLVYGRSIMILNVTDTTAVTLVDGTISYTASTKVLVFTPTSNWTASDSLAIVITPEVTDTAGNAMTIFNGHFTVTA